MKRTFGAFLLLAVLIFASPQFVMAESGSYLDTIYQAKEEGESCIPGYDCPGDKACGTEGCEVGETCKDGKCVPTCEGDNCDENDSCENGVCKPICGNDTCGVGEECVDGVCVQKDDIKDRVQKMLRRIQRMLNNLINRIINKLMGINIKIGEVKIKPPVKPEPKPIRKPRPKPEPRPEPIQKPEPKPEPEPEPEPSNNVYKEHTNFEEAKKAAKEKGHPIMMVFSGSDWCGWCKKFQAEVLSQNVFKDYAKDNMETFIADFPRRTQQSPELEKQNRKLMAKYGVRGFPTVMIVNPDGSVIKKTGYIKGGADNYVKHLKGIIGK